MTQGFDISPEELKTGERLFRKQSAFVAGAAEPARLPEGDLPEIVFWGRSNVGKSSLINGLTFRKGLARASNTPGRTQQINFFDLGGVVTLVDLPGYGYAKASREKIEDWSYLIGVYLQDRTVIARLCMLIDARHGIKEPDREAAAFLDQMSVPYVVVLTKTDKIKKTECDAVIAATEEGVRDFKNAFPKVYPTSAEKGWGMDALRAALAQAAHS